MTGVSELGAGLVISVGAMLTLHDGFIYDDIIVDKQALLCSKRRA